MKNLLRKIVMVVLCAAMIIPIEVGAALPTIQEIVNDFTTIFGRKPTHTEQEYWKSRREDKGTREALKGAMGYHYVQGQTMPGHSIVSVPSISEIVSLFRDVFGHPPTHSEQEYWKGRREDKPTLSSLRGTMTYYKSLNMTMPGKKIPLSHRLHEAFRSVFGRNPNQRENDYWLMRILNGDKTTYDALVGAMFYAKSQAKTVGEDPTISDDEPVTSFCLRTVKKVSLSLEMSTTLVKSVRSTFCG